VLWYRQGRAAVRTSLEAGERPDLATTMACGPLDELIALHDEPGLAITSEQPVGQIGGRSCPTAHAPSWTWSMPAGNRCPPSDVESHQVGDRHEKDRSWN
jgi:hypothetical protein